MLEFSSKSFFSLSLFFTAYITCQLWCYFEYRREQIHGNSLFLLGATLFEGAKVLILLEDIIDWNGKEWTRQLQVKDEWIRDWSWNSYFERWWSPDAGKSFIFISLHPSMPTLCFHLTLWTTPLFLPMAHTLLLLSILMRSRI